MIETMLNELRQEAAATRRVLEKVPEEQLKWRPHPKSMSLGQLALHVATIPGAIAKLAQLEEFDASQANFEPPSPEKGEEILAAFDVSVGAAEDYLQNLDDETAARRWRLTSKGNEVFTVPRSGMLRTIMLNHWYHHRGQLSVYLRLLEVPVPAVYGRSADENPFR
ncbi:MAG TPA: DinB family protein [Blastocatellia bacterium]|nr:DinB family protein [Blastocatellia bacterium]